MRISRENVWAPAALRAALAVIAVLFGRWFKISTALSEIVLEIAAPVVFVVLFLGKMVSNVVGLFPTVKAFRYQAEEGLSYTLMMSTGLTFGTISSLFGLAHGIIDQNQYSYLVATVIGSAVVPTMIANLLFLPRHLLPKEEKGKEPRVMVVEERMADAE